MTHEALNEVIEKTIYYLVYSIWFYSVLEDINQY